MASIPSALIVSLICLSQDHMGVQGETPTVFSSVGGDATLSCSNVFYPNCSSTTWLSSSSGNTAELFIHGKINPAVATPRPETLSLDSNCSLHITDVNTEDAGVYFCQQWQREGGAKHGEDASVYLSVLNVSASPSETEMEANSHVTLHCLLHTPYSCIESGADKGVSLSWVDETGKELQNINNLQTRTTSPCSITLTEKPRGPNPVHTRTCQLTAGGQVQTSVSHTIRVKGVKPTTSSTSVSKSSPRTKTVTTASSNSGPSATKSSPPPTDSGTPAANSSPPPTDKGTPDVPLVAGVVVSVSLLAAALMILVVICKRRTNAGGEPRHKSTQSSARVMQSVQPPISSDNEEGADLHYAAFQHLNPTQAGPSAKQSEDTVTYSTIMQLSGGEDQNSSRPAGRPADPNTMYATVQKNNKIQN